MSWLRKLFRSRDYDESQLHTCGEVLDRMFQRHLSRMEAVVPQSKQYVLKSLEKHYPKFRYTAADRMEICYFNHETSTLRYPIEEDRIIVYISFLPYTTIEIRDFFRKTSSEPPLAYMTFLTHLINQTQPYYDIIVHFVVLSATNHFNIHVCIYPLASLRKSKGQDIDLHTEDEGWGLYPEEIMSDKELHLIGIR